MFIPIEFLESVFPSEDNILYDGNNKQQWKSVGVSIYRQCNQYILLLMNFAAILLVSYPSVSDGSCLDVLTIEGSCRSH